MVLILVVFVQRAGLEKDLMAYLSQCLIIKDYQRLPKYHYKSVFDTSLYDDNNKNRKNDLILIMTPEKQDKTLELSKHWSVDSTPARNEVIMKRTYPVKLVKYDKICSNY